MDSVFVYMTFIWGQNKGSKRGILVEQRGQCY
ncbi:BnaC04g29300D [Brassica napus]|uniref:BnaC04g29300D protein n=1 Tax=Brassica napus TaxID=3708 RepID=A0A078FHM6_BRANA|nr:BnaC04g29300D [Brassica napus]